MPVHQNHTGTACGRPSGRVIVTQISRIARRRRSIVGQARCPRIRLASLTQQLSGVESRPAYVGSRPVIKVSPIGIRRTVDR